MNEQEHFRVITTWAKAILKSAEITDIAIGLLADEIHIDLSPHTSVTYDKLLLLSKAFGTTNMYFHFDQGEPNLSEVTPGYPSSLTLVIRGYDVQLCPR